MTLLHLATRSIVLTLLVLLLPLIAMLLSTEMQCLPACVLLLWAELAVGIFW